MYSNSQRLVPAYQSVRGTFVLRENNYCGYYLYSGSSLYYGRETSPELTVASISLQKGGNMSTNKPRDKTRRGWQNLLQAKGQGLVEYAMILVMVAVVIIVILTFIGQQVFNGLYSKISSAMPPP